MIEFNEQEAFIVTGASFGIGRAISLKINELGGRVLAVARDKDRLEKAKASSRFPDNFYVEVKDLVHNMDDLPKWIIELSKKHGKLKGLVLAAGILQVIPLNALNIREAKELFDVNYFSNVALCKGFCDKRVAVKEGGSIIFISSISSIRGQSGTLTYSASKGAVNSAVRALAAELARVGLVDTKMKDQLADSMPPDLFSEMLNKHALGVGMPEDIASAACFLLSNNSRWITGQCFVVDGGASLS